MERFNNRYKRDMKQQRTAMQELIHIMNNSVGLENGFEWRRVANLLLEKEKEQMEKVWVAGLYCETGDRQAFIDYYKETYKSE